MCFNLANAGADAVAATGGVFAASGTAASAGQSFFSAPTVWNVVILLGLVAIGGALYLLFMLQKEGTVTLDAKQLDVLKKGVAEVTVQVLGQHKLLEHVQYATTVIASVSGHYNGIVSKIEQMNADLVQMKQNYCGIEGWYHEAMAKYNEAIQVVPRLQKDLDDARAKAQEQARRMEVLDEVGQIIQLNTEAANELEQVKKDLAVERTKVEGLESEKACQAEVIQSKEGEVAKLTQQLEDQMQAHRKALEEKETANRQKVEQLQATHQEELRSCQARASEELEKVKKDISDFAPEEVFELFGYVPGSEDAKRLMGPVYAYLGLLRGSLRENDIVANFRHFENSLDAGFMDDEALGECRKKVEGHLNSYLRAQKVGVAVEWPRRDVPYDSTVCNSDSTSGTAISKVLSAVVYGVGEDGKRKCLNKGKVLTH